jgi:antitoxin VapB
MGISIRNPEVEALARKLADRRGTTMTEAIAHALRKDLEATPSETPLWERLEALAQETMAMAGPNGRALTKDEIDDLWGQ